MAKVSALRRTEDDVVCMLGSRMSAHGARPSVRPGRAGCLDEVQGSGGIEAMGPPGRGSNHGRCARAVGQCCAGLMRCVSSCGRAGMAQQARQFRRLGLLQGVGHGRIGQALKTRRLGVFESRAAWRVGLSGGRQPGGNGPMAQSVPPGCLLCEQQEQGQEGVRHPTPGCALSSASGRGCRTMAGVSHAGMLPRSRDSFSASRHGPRRAPDLCPAETWPDFAERPPPAPQSAGAVRWIGRCCPPRRFSGRGGSGRLA